jgi:hypothetical protein
MTLTYARRHHYESISDIVYWRWEDRPLGNIQIAKEIAAKDPQMRLFMLQTYQAPRIRVSLGRYKRPRVLFTY